MKPTKEIKPKLYPAYIIPAYSPDMDEPDSANQLHKCGECGAGYRWKKHLLRLIRSKHEVFKYSSNQCEYQSKQPSTMKLQRINTQMCYLFKYLTSVSTRQHNRDIFRLTKWSMRVNIHVWLSGNATGNFEEPQRFHAERWYIIM